MVQLIGAALVLLVFGLAIGGAVRTDRRTRAEHARRPQRAALASTVVTEADGDELRAAWPYIVAMLEHGDLASADDVDRVIAKLTASGFAGIAEEANIELGFDGGPADRAEVYNLGYTTERATCSSPALLDALQRLATALRAFEAAPPSRTR